MVTFAAGSFQWRRTGRKLCRQARRLGVFNRVTLHTDKSLPKADRLFWEFHGDYMNAVKTGFGHWIWKPKIILHELKSMKDGDVLLYLDAGCKFNPYNRQRLIAWALICQKYEVMARIMPGYKIEDCTKMDTLIEFQADKSIRNADMFNASIIMLRRSANVIKTMNEWYSALNIDNHHHVDGSASLNPNVKSFRYHHFEESTLSILLRKRCAVHEIERTYSPHSPVMNVSTGNSGYLGNLATPPYLIDFMLLKEKRWYRRLWLKLIKAKAFTGVRALTTWRRYQVKDYLIGE